MTLCPGIQHHYSLTQFQYPPADEIASAQALLDLPPDSHLNYFSITYTELFQWPVGLPQAPDPAYTMIL